MYVPDDWVILKIEGVEPKPFYKVLAGWSDASENRWRLNSGIEKIENTHSYYNFIGSTGSIYKCHKGSEGIRGMMGEIITSLLEAPHINISVVPVEEAISGIKANSSGTKE